MNKTGSIGTYSPIRIILGEKLFQMSLGLLSALGPLNLIFSSLEAADPDLL